MKKRRKRSLGAALPVVLAFTVLGASSSSASGYQRPGTTERVSTASGGSEWSGNSGSTPSGNSQPALSSNGRYVAFTSQADNLIRPSDIFVKDRKTGKTQLASISSSGVAGLVDAAAWRGAVDPAISGNGRYVAFWSDYPNLVENDRNVCEGAVGPVPGSCADIFVHDRKQGITERVSVASDGTEGNDRAIGAPDISRNGRFVAFSSYATNLVENFEDECSLPIPSLSPLPTPNLDSQLGCGALRVYVHDRKSKQTEMVSVASDGTPANMPSKDAAISADGRFVAFTSEADNLVPNLEAPCDQLPSVNRLRPRCEQVYLHDRRTGKTELVSVSPDGEGGDGPSRHAAGSRVSVSDSGRFVSFQSQASNLVPSDVNGSDDMFVRDMKSKRTVRASVTSAGEAAEGGTGMISGSGRVMSFNARSSISPHDPCPEDPFCGGVHLHDLRTGATEAIAIRSGKSAWFSSTDAGGRFVGFVSNADDLVPDDNNDAWDVFVHDRGVSVSTLGLGGSPPPDREPAPEDRICVSTDVCIPPGAAVSSSDATNDLDEALTKQGANLYGASLAYRPQYTDLFVAVELEHMPKVIPGTSPIFYGLRFKVESKSYEVRASSLLGGSFGLFQCTATTTSKCTNVAGLQGGYGTTGQRVVFSLPLDEIGLTHGGKLRKVTAFSGVGSYVTGVAKVLDRVRLK